MSLIPGSPPFPKVLPPALSLPAASKAKSATQTPMPLITFRAIAFGPAPPYICAVGQPTMAIHGLRNKRCGPGGGTRRLHQFRRLPNTVGAGALRGRNRLDARGKGKTVARHDTTVIGSQT